MNSVTVRIDGMMCGMCEAHINNVIRNLYPKAKKVKSSRRTGECTFLLDGEVDRDKLRSAIDETGYTFVSCEVTA